MLTINKLISKENLPEYRTALKQQGKTLVVTNGCFDLLHVGHVHFLQEAARRGDVLLVGVNSDRSVQALKGPDRPIYSEEARLYLLNALACVDKLFVIEGPHLAEELELIAPDVYVKAGDYTLESLNPYERKALERVHAKIEFLHFQAGWSTSN